MLLDGATAFPFPRPLSFKVEPTWLSLDSTAVTRVSYAASGKRWDLWRVDPRRLRGEMSRDPLPVRAAVFLSPTDSAPYAKPLPPVLGAARLAAAVHRLPVRSADVVRTVDAIQRSARSFELSGSRHTEAPAELWRLLSVELPPLQIRGGLPALDHTEDVNR